MHTIYNFVKHLIEILKGKIGNSTTDRLCENALGRFLMFSTDHSSTRSTLSPPPWCLKKAYRDTVEKRLEKIVWPSYLSVTSIADIFSRTGHLKSKEVEKVGSVLFRYLFHDLECTGLRNYLFGVQDTLIDLVQVYIDKTRIEELYHKVLDLLILKEGIFPSSTQFFVDHQLLHLPQ
jgi:hypothetical protein